MSGPANLSSTSSAAATPEVHHASTRVIPDWNKAHFISEGLPQSRSQRLTTQNGNIYRQFQHANDRGLHYLQYRLALIDETLHQYEIQHPELLKRLTAGQRRGILDVPCEEWERSYDLLMNEWLIGSEQYNRAVLTYRELHKLPQVHDREVRGQFNWLDVHDPDILNAAYAIDDFVYLSPDPAHLSFLNLMYSRLGLWVGRSMFPNSESVLLHKLGLCLQLLQTFFWTSLIVIPAAILSLGNLGLRACFGVTVGFLSVCSIVLVAVGVDAHVRMGVACAYAAVLMAFLAQIGVQSG